MHTCIVDVEHLVILRLTFHLSLSHILNSHLSIASKRNGASRAVVNNNLMQTFYWYFFSLTKKFHKIMQEKTSFVSTYFKVMVEC